MPRAAHEARMSDAQPRQALMRHIPLARRARLGRLGARRARREDPPADRTRMQPEHDERERNGQRLAVVPSDLPAQERLGAPHAAVRADELGSKAQPAAARCAHPLEPARGAQFEADRTPVQVAGAPGLGSCRRGRRGGCPGADSRLPLAQLRALRSMPQRAGRQPGPLLDPRSLTNRTGATSIIARQASARCALGMRMAIMGTLRG